MMLPKFFRVVCNRAAMGMRDDHMWLRLPLSVSYYSRGSHTSSIQAAASILLIFVWSIDKLFSRWVGWKWVIRPFSHYTNGWLHTTRELEWHMTSNALGIYSSKMFKPKMMDVICAKSTRQSWKRSWVA